MDWAIVTLFCLLLHGFLTVLCFVRLHNWVMAAFANLDSAIAGAIQKVLTESGDFEPPNPVQTAIAQFITQRMQQPPAEPISLSRDEQGKFS